MERRETTHTVIREVLRDHYLHLQVLRYQIAEELGDEAGCTLHLELKHPGGGDAPLVIEGQGVGVVAAAYDSLIKHFTREYGSLGTVKFVGFDVSSQMESSRHGQGTDAEATVHVTVHNSEGRPFEFHSRDRSVLAATIDAVVQIAEYFVNSERAFVMLHRALLDAKGRHRADLVEQYTSKLAELVNSTSYSEVIQKIREESLRG